MGTPYGTLPTAMNLLVLSCPTWTLPLPPALADAPRRAVPERPAREDLAPVLAGLADPTRLVVAGTDADLAAVVLRLLRTERLAAAPVAYLPAAPDSAVAAVWGLPTDPVEAGELAVHGEPDPVPLVRDDVGGVLLGRAELRPMRGTVYCDDTRLLRGQANRLEVTPSAPEGVTARAVRIGALGLRSCAGTGRAVSVGCLSAGVVCDGVPYSRPVTRWTWYRHTEPWRLVRGAW